jgi:hypothetical protein
MQNKGLAIHCHHDQLIEWCHSYTERVDYINSNKPEHEKATRLRLFKLLPKEAIRDLPKGLVWARAEWGKARAELDKAYAEWGKADREAWHKKWCGCSEWDGNEIRFK